MQRLKHACASCLLVWSVLVSSASSAASQAGQAGSPPATPRVLAEHTHTRDVRKIALDGPRVWVASSGGLALHARESGARVLKLGARDGLPGNNVHDVVLLEAGSALVATEQGAARVRAPAGAQAAPLAVERVSAPASAALFDPARAVLPALGRVPAALLYLQSGVRDQRARAQGERAAGMWSAAARNARGVALGSLDGRLRVPARDGRAVELLLPRPALAIAALGDDFAIATGDSLERWDGRGLTPLRFQGTAIAASALGHAQDGSLLIGSANGRVLELRAGELRALATVDGRVTALAADRTQLWLGVAGQGLVRIARGGGAARALQPSGEICSNHVTHFTRHAGALVAGSFDRGACYLQGDRWHALATDSPYVHGLASDGERLWIAHSNGIARFDRAWAPLPIAASAGDPPALIEVAARAATAALRLDDGALLFASASGVLELRRDPQTSALRARHYGRKRGVPAEITALAADGERVYVASETAGVVELRAGKLRRRLRDPDALPEAWVTALAANGGTLWAGTCQRGVARVSARGATTLDRTRGLPGDRVIALAHSRHGTLIGTLSGLALASSNGATAQPWTLPLPDRRVSGLFAEDDALWIATEFGLSELR